MDSLSVATDMQGVWEEDSVPRALFGYTVTFLK